MTDPSAAWERIKRYAYHHAHPHDLEQIQEDVDTVERVVGGRPVTAPLARTGRQTIDRDALVNVLIDLAQQAHYAGDADGWVVDLNPFVDRILALVQPVEGVVIEDRYARHIHRLLWEALLPQHEYPIETRTEGEWLLAQLAARLEASA